jgi:AcrR family transcriptional regulator
MHNREAILQAALELFAAQGYEACGVQEICETVALTKPTLYHYFGSKRGLLEALLEQNHPAFAAAVADASVYSGDLPLTLERIARTYFAFARDQATYYRLLLALYFAPPESEARRLMVERSRAQHEAIEGMFTAAAADHGNLRGKAGLFAALFTGTLNTCIGLWLSGSVALDDELLRRAVRQFQYGIYSG